MFDRTKYKTIINFQRPDNYTDMLDWVDSNTNGSVKVEVSFINRQEDNSMPWYAPAGLYPATIYMGFENVDDATFFKIKYSV